MADPLSMRTHDASEYRAANEATKFECEGCKSIFAFNAEAFGAETQQTRNQVHTVQALHRPFLREKLR